MWGGARLSVNNRSVMPTVRHSSIGCLHNLEAQWTLTVSTAAVDGSEIRPTLLASTKPY